MMDANVRVDETSCGPFCQHPYCWYSNRRVERGLPQTQSLDKENFAAENSEELPTMKVLNLLGEYGFDPGDRYQTHQQLPRTTRRSSNEEDQQGRSHSAPIVRQLIDQPPQVVPPQKTSPKTPYQTPVQSRGGPQKVTPASSKLARHTNKSAPARAAPFSYQELGNRIKKVDMRDALEIGGLRHQGPIPAGKIYVWCPSSSKGQDNQPSSSQDALPKAKVHPKDVTADMLPETLAANHSNSKRVKKKAASHQTPTGGRPYTHPARSPPPLTRRTLPQDYDEGIAQLLQLPREVLLEILEHTKESDLFDKTKVAMLLEKLMPLIQFDKDDVTHRYARPISPISLQFSSHTSIHPPPLHSSGILRQKKVTLLEGRQKRAESVRAPPPTRSMPFFLDESAMSGITSSTYTRRERPERHADEDRDTTMPSPTIISEDMVKRKSHGPVRGAPTEMSHYSRRKVTSVSAKTLPPLQPGVRAIRPFNYTSQSFDLALSPLSTPDYQASEKESSPYSGRASTVRVTVPSYLSDHTPPQSPCTCERTPIPPIPPRQGSAHYSTISTVPSDGFNAIHGSAAFPATQIFRVPYGTPSMPKHESLLEEDALQSGTTRCLERVNEANLPADSPLAATSAVPTTHATAEEEVTDADPSRQERQINTATTDSRDTYALLTPMKPPESTSPYDAATSVMAQASEKAAGSPMVPVTPVPSVASPEVWPMVDERDYMKSPEKMERLTQKKIDMILAPVAPPPSPEPAGLDMDYEIHDMANKSTAGSSLTPLAEEEEEEGDLVREEEGTRSPGPPEVQEALPHAEAAEATDGDPSAGGVEDNPAETVEKDIEMDRTETRETDAERIGTRSRGYLGDDEDVEDDIPKESVQDKTDPEMDKGQDSVPENNHSDDNDIEGEDSKVKEDIGTSAEELTERDALGENTSHIEQVTEPSHVYGEVEHLEISQSIQEVPQNTPVPESEALDQDFMESANQQLDNGTVQ